MAGKTCVGMGDVALLWVSLADERPGRELRWLRRIDGIDLGVVSGNHPEDADWWIPGQVVRPVKRFVEAGAIAWYESTADWPTDVEWVGSLEPVSLITGQVSRWRSSAGVKQLVVTWENDQHQPLYRLPGFRRALKDSLAADLFLCPIRAAADHLRVLGVPADRIEVVAPGVDTDLFHPADEPVERPTLVFCSPLARNKGIDRVLAALPKVQRRIPEVELRVMGTGPLSDRVRRASAAGLPVRYLGSGGPADVASFLRTGAVFVTAPRPTWKWNEQFGLAYIEAMASGLPIVTTRCGTNHEAVRPPNGFVGDDVDELASAIVAFLADDRMRADVGARNRRLVLDRHDARTQSDRIGAVLRAR